jgi:two-component system, NarL family, nitrate/nitrite response regulator NarL
VTVAIRPAVSSSQPKLVTPGRVSSLWLTTVTAETPRCHADAVRVLIVDDHAEFRESARALLEAEGLEVAGVAADAEEAVAEAVILAPDVVLLDVQLPGEDGFVAADRLSGLPHPPRVVMVSSRDARSYAARLAQSTAVGFLGKSELSAAALTRLLT